MHPHHTTALPDGARSGSFAKGMTGAMLVAFALSVSATSPAHAAETSASAAAALKVLAMPLGDANSPASPATATTAATTYNNPAPRGNSITVQKGEGIDAVIRRGLPGLPLKEEFLRQALAKANPKVFPRGQTYPVRPGTVLMLPSHEELRQLIVSRHPQAAELFQAIPADSPEPDVAPGPDKRRWVRFP